MLSLEQIFNRAKYYIFAGVIFLIIYLAGYSYCETRYPETIENLTIGNVANVSTTASTVSESVISSDQALIEQRQKAINEHILSSDASKNWGESDKNALSSVIRYGCIQQLNVINQLRKDNKITEVERTNYLEQFKINERCGALV